VDGSNATGTDVETVRPPAADIANRINGWPVIDIRRFRKLKTSKAHEVTNAISSNLQHMKWADQAVR
jgi:hypothetical protein